MADVVGLDVQVRASGVETARSSIDRLDHSFQRARTSALGLSGLIVNLNQGFDLISRVSRPFVGLAQGFIGAASRAESLQARLVGLTGGVEQAAMAFERMRTIAARTPFQVPDVVQAGIQLKAMGIEADDALDKLTDLAAFMGRDLTETAFAVGRAFSGGLGGAEILREGGILPRVEAAAKRLGLKFGELKDLTLPQFRQALLAAFDDKIIAGSAARISATFEGRISNLADAWGNLQTKFGEIVTRSPAVRGVISQLEQVVTDAATATVKWTQENRGLVESTVKDWAGELFRIIGQIPDAIPGILRTADSFLRIGTQAAAAMGPLGDLLERISAVASAWNSLPAELRAFAVAGGATLVATRNPALALAAGAGAAAGTAVNRFQDYARSPNNRFRFGPSAEAINLATQTPEFSRFRGASYADISKAASFGDAAAKELNKTLLAIERQRKQAVREPEQPRGVVPAQRPEIQGPPAFLKPGAGGRIGADAGADGGKGGGGGSDTVERRAQAAAEAQETRARTLAELQQQRLSDLQREVQVNGQIVSRGGELLAAAQQVEAAERGRIEAQIRGLQVEQQKEKISSEERDALQAKIEALRQEANLLSAVREVRADIAREIASEAESVRALIGGPLREYEQTMARIRPLVGAQGGITGEEFARFEQAQRGRVLSQVGLSDGLEEAAEKWRQLDEAAVRFGVSSDKVAEGQRRIVDQLNGVGDTGQSMMRELISATEQWGRNFTETFASALEGAKGGFKDLATSLLKDLNRLIIHETVTKPLFGAVRDALSGRHRYTEEEVAAAAGGGRAPGVSATRNAAAVGIESSASRLAGGVETSVNRMGTALGGVVETVRAGFSSILGGLAAGASTFLGALLGGGGGGNFLRDFGMNFLGRVIGGGISYAGGALFGGGAEGVPMSQQLQGLERDFDVKFAHRGGLIMHRGGIAGQMAQLAGNHGLTGGGSRLAPDEVPAILQRGELVIPRHLAQDVADLLQVRPTVRRYHDGGIVESARSPRRGDTPADAPGGPQNVFHLPMEIKVASLDPENAAAVILRHEREIVGMVNRNIRRGGELARSVGIRGGA